MKILVCDDSDDARDLMEAAILSAGYDALTAASANEAISILEIDGMPPRPPRIDLILLDVMMPEVDGIEACARIRSNDRYADIPILMVTALDDMESLSNAFVSGANDYITKPINRIELIARVRSALKLKSELERRKARERELLSFLSSWGDRRATLWIDEATGLFVGEMAEAYLTASTQYQTDELISIVTLALDRFDVFRAANGNEAAQVVLSRIAQTIRRVTAQIGVVAAAYRNGVVVLIAPEYDEDAARTLGETLRAAIARLRLANSEGIAADTFTASVGVVTGHVRRGIGRIHLLTHAISMVQTAAGGNVGDRVLAMRV